MRSRLLFLLLISCDHRAATMRYAVTIDGRDHLLAHGRAAFRRDGLELVLSENPVACGEPADPVKDDLTGTRVELHVPLGFGDFFAGQPFTAHLGACVRGAPSRLGPCDHDWHVAVTMDPVRSLAPGGVVTGSIRRDRPGDDDADERNDRVDGAFVAELCPGRYPGRRLPAPVDGPLAFTVEGRPVPVSQLVLIRPPSGSFHELLLYTDGQSRSCAERRAERRPERTLVLAMQSALAGAWQPAGASFVIRGSETSGASLTTGAVRFDAPPGGEGTEIAGTVVARDENADMGIPPLVANGRFRALICSYR